MLTTHLRRQVLELGARWYVFLFLNVYGFAKLLNGQFYRRGHLPPEVAQMTLANAGAFELAWTFMGYSKAYMVFIGLTEILGAWLLLWNRTKLLGVAVLLPVMVNVIVFDVIFFRNDEYGALASASIYTILLFAILACNRDRVTKAFESLTQGQATPLTRKLVLIVLVCMALCFALDQALVTLLGHGRG
jgi:hypothetical protein